MRIYSLFKPIIDVQPQAQNNGFTEAHRNWTHTCTSLHFAVSITLQLMVEALRGTNALVVTSTQK